MIEYILAMSIQQIAAWIFVLGTVAALSPKVRAGVKRMWSFLFPTRALLVSHLKESEETLGKIYAELRPNGSTSLRDAIDRAEAQLKDIDAFLSAQLNVHDVAVIRTDENGSLIYVNRHYQRLLGVAAHEVMGEGWVNVIHPEERLKIYKMWKDAVASKREFSEDIRFLRPDGVEVFGHANVYREINSDGDLRGYLGVITVPGTECPEIDTCFERLMQRVKKEGELHIAMEKSDEC